MIDLHCHILPAWTTALPTRRSRFPWRATPPSGVTAIAVTPHCNLPGFRRNYRGPDYRRQLNDLRELLTQEKHSAAAVLRGRGIRRPLEHPHAH